MEQAERAILNFVVCKVIRDCSGLYYKTQVDNRMSKVFTVDIFRRKRSCEIAFADRPFSNKVFRIIYKVFRAVFVSFGYYYLAFTSTLWPFFLGWPYSTSTISRAQWRKDNNY